MAVFLSSFWASDLFNRIQFMCLPPSMCDRRPQYLGFIWRKSIKSNNQIVLIWFFFPYNSGHQQPSVMVPNLLNLRLVWICSVCGHPHPMTHTNHGMFWTHGTMGGASCYISDRRFYQKADQAGSSSWVGTKSVFFSLRLGVSEWGGAFSRCPPSRAFQHTSLRRISLLWDLWKHGEITHHV